MGKELYLIRHAKSSWEGSEGLADVNRPLAIRGVNDAISMGQFLRKQNIKLDKLISSNGIRALHTATIMAKEMQVDFNCLEINSDLYHADMEDFLRVIQAVDDQIEKIAIFSHNPGLSNFAFQSNAPVDHVSTNGVLHYKIKTKSWCDVSFNELDFISYLKPKDLI